MTPDSQNFTSPPDRTELQKQIAESEAKGAILQSTHDKLRGKLEAERTDMQRLMDSEEENKRLENDIAIMKRGYLPGEQGDFNPQEDDED